MNVKNIKVGTLITSDMLEQMEACNKQVQIFKMEWPNGVRIRKKSLFRAAKIGLDLDWFAEVLPRKEYDKYCNLFVEDRTGSVMGDAALSFWEVIRERGR